MQKLAQKSVEEGLTSGVAEGAANGAKEAAGALKENVSLSQAGKEASAKGLKPESIKEDLKENLKEVPNKIKDKVVEGKSAGQHLLTQAGSAVLRAVTGGALPGISLPKLSAPNPPPQVANKVMEVKDPDGPINKPGIFFIRGFSVNPFESEEAGLGAMSKNIPSSNVFSWSDQDQIMEEIKKRPHTQPIILVGHGMGGDTAVEITNQLNSVDHGFRRVDLLVTLDSVGTDNDIIPQNVRENYNLISDQDFLFNDGPNIARKKEMTKITNELLAANHDELEHSTEIQFLVYEKINSTLMNAIARRDFKEALNQKMIESHKLGPKSPNLS